MEKYKGIIESFKNDLHSAIKTIFNYYYNKHKHIKVEYDPTDSSYWIQYPDTDGTMQSIVLYENITSNNIESLEKLDNLLYIIRKEQEIF